MEVRPLAAQLLAASSLVGEKRFATHDGRAYCAQVTQNDLWHGYPVGWKEVPHTLRLEWRRGGLVRRRDIRRNWD